MPLDTWILNTETDLKKARKPDTVDAVRDRIPFSVSDKVTVFQKASDPREQTPQVGALEEVQEKLDMNEQQREKKSVVRAASSTVGCQTKGTCCPTSSSEIWQKYGIWN